VLELAQRGGTASDRRAADRLQRRWVCLAELLKGASGGGGGVRFLGRPPHPPGGGVPGPAPGGLAGGRGFGGPRGGGGGADLGSSAARAWVMQGMPGVSFYLLPPQAAA